MASSPRYAIIGSCCTRDLFGLGLPGYGPEDVSLYIARTTAVSMMADPVPRAVRWWSDAELTGFHLKRFAWDLDKRHFDLLAHADWDVLLIDLATEYHPTMRMGSSAAAAVPRVRPYLDPIIESGTATLVNAKDMLDDTIAAIGAMARRVRDVAAGRPVLVHEALRAKWFLQDGRRVLFPAAAGIDRWNDFTLRCQSALLADSDFTLLQAPADAVVAGGDHLWQLSPLHYDRSYYERLALQVDGVLQGHESASR